MKNNRILILTGGYSSITFISEYLLVEEFTTIIAVDRGLMVADRLDIPIDYLVGDFDSVPEEVLDKYRDISRINNTFRIIEYNPVKDSTDTHIAINLAMDLPCDEMVILGGTGTRIDHVLANIQLLRVPLEKGVKTVILDEHNKIYLINNGITLRKDKLYGDYISLIPYTEKVINVTLEGFKYPLYNKTLVVGDSLGVSNEIISDEANILLDSGTLIVIESRD
jgi:thiamine pyrophosphokinase